MMNSLSLFLARNYALKMGLTLLILIPTNAMSELNVIGEERGRSQQLSCPANKFAVGLFIVHDNQVIIRVRLRCAGVNSKTGSALPSTTMTKSSSTSRPGDFGLVIKNYNCPKGQFLSSTMRGYTGKLGFKRVVSGLIGYCVNFSNIDVNTGTSRKKDGPDLRTGANFNGPFQKSRAFDVTGYSGSEIAMNGLSVHSEYALISVKVKAKKMPWVIK